MRKIPGPGKLVCVRDDVLLRENLLLELTKRMTLGRIGQNLGESRFPECNLHHRHRIIQPFMQRA